MHTRFTPAALVVALLAPLAAWSQVSISVNIGPPPPLAYEPPMVPGEGYSWTPGSWGWSQRDRESCQQQDERGQPRNNRGEGRGRDKQRHERP